MKKLARTIIGFIVMALGAGLVIFGGVLLAQSPSWMTGAGFLAFFVLGGSIALVGLEIVKGDRISDIVRDLFENLSRW